MLLAFFLSFLLSSSFCLQNDSILETDAFASAMLPRFVGKNSKESIMNLRNAIRNDDRAFLQMNLASPLFTHEFTVTYEIQIIIREFFLLDSTILLDTVLRGKSNFYLKSLFCLQPSSKLAVSFWTLPIMEKYAAARDWDALERFLDLLLDAAGISSVPRIIMLTKFPFFINAQFVDSLSKGTFEKYKSILNKLLHLLTIDKGIYDDFMDLMLKSWKKRDNAKSYQETRNSIVLTLLVFSGHPTGSDSDFLITLIHELLSECNTPALNVLSDVFGYQPLLSWVLSMLETEKDRLIKSLFKGTCSENLDWLHEFLPENELDSLIEDSIMFENLELMRPAVSLEWSHNVSIMDEYSLVVIASLLNLLESSNDTVLAHEFIEVIGIPLVQEEVIYAYQRGVFHIGPDDIEALAKADIGSLFVLNRVFQEKFNCSLFKPVESFLDKYMDDEYYTALMEYFMDLDRDIGRMTWLKSIRPDHWFAELLVWFRFNYHSYGKSIGFIREMSIHGLLSDHETSILLWDYEYDDFNFRKSPINFCVTSHHFECVRWILEWVNAAFSQDQKINFAGTLAQLVTSAEGRIDPGSGFLLSSWYFYKVRRLLPGLEHSLLGSRSMEFVLAKGHISASQFSLGHVGHMNLPLFIYFVNVYISNGVNIFTFEAIRKLCLMANGEWDLDKLFVIVGLLDVKRFGVSVIEFKNFLKEVLERYVLQGIFSNEMTPLLHVTICKQASMYFSLLIRRYGELHGLHPDFRDKNLVQALEKMFVWRHILMNEREEFLASFDSLGRRLGHVFSFLLSDRMYGVKGLEGSRIHEALRKCKGTVGSQMIDCYFFHLLEPLAALGYRKRKRDDELE